MTGLILVYDILALARLLLRDRWLRFSALAVLVVLAQLVIPSSTMPWLMLPALFCDV